MLISYNQEQESSIHHGSMQWPSWPPGGSCGSVGWSVFLSYLVIWAWNSNTRSIPTKTVTAVVWCYVVTAILRFSQPPHLFDKLRSEPSMTDRKQFPHLEAYPYLCPATRIGIWWLQMSRVGGGYQYTQILDGTCLYNESLSKAVSLERCTILTILYGDPGHLRTIITYLSICGLWRKTECTNPLQSIFTSGVPFWFVSNLRCWTASFFPLGPKF